MRRDQLGCGSLTNMKQVQVSAAGKLRSSQEHQWIMIARETSCQSKHWIVFGEVELELDTTRRS